MVLQPALQKLAKAFQKFMKHAEASLDIQLQANNIAMKSRIWKLWGTSREASEANRVRMHSDEKNIKELEASLRSLNLDDEYVKKVDVEVAKRLH